MLVPVVSAMFKPPEDEMIPVEFMVVDPSMISSEPQPEPPAPFEEPQHEPTPPVPDDPVEEPDPPRDTHEKPEPKPEVRPKPKPEDIRQNGRKIKIGDTKPKVQTDLTEEEIRKLLKQGVPIGDHVSIPPSQQQRMLSLIRQALNRNWVRPERSEQGDLYAKLTIQLAPNGRIISSRITRSSGNSAMDQSVLRSAASTGQIDGLDSAFLAKYSEITIDFVHTAE
jgi:TonB family protein